jgi:hypothetical protein
VCVGCAQLLRGDCHRDRESAARGAWGDVESGPAPELPTAAVTRRLRVLHHHGMAAWSLSRYSPSLSRSLVSLYLCLCHCPSLAVPLTVSPPPSLCPLCLWLCFCRHAKYSDAEQRDLVVKYARALRHFGSRFLDSGGIGDDDDADRVGRGIGGVGGTGTGGGSSTSTSTDRSGSGGFAFALQHLLWTMKSTGPVLDALGPQQRLAVLRVCCVLLERLRAAPSYRAGVVVTGSNAATAAVALGWIQQVRVCVRASGACKVHAQGRGHGFLVAVVCG